MQTSSSRKTVLLFGVLVLFMVSPAAASWNITVLDQPYSFQNVSNATDTAQVIELTDGDGTPINKSQLGESGTYVQYKYNGSTIDMTWLHGGYWYADFKLNDTGGSVEFEAEGVTESDLLTDSTSETNATRTFNLGNMSVDLMTNFSGQVNPEDSFDIKVNVTDTVNNTFETGANVDLYFTNKSWTSEIYDINNKGDEDNDNADDHYKNFGLNFDLDYNSTYVLHVNATNSSAVGYNSSYGVQSITVKTLPEIQGQVEYMNASAGCKNESFFTECERDATIDTGFNITSASANNVNLTLQLMNSSDKWEANKSTTLSTENGLYTGEITVPDINTSEYDRKFRLKYNASKDDREDIVTKVITYEDFKIVDKSDSVTGKGSYRVKLEIRKYFTPELLNTDRIDDSSVTVKEPSGDELTSFEVSDMERLPDSGHFKKKITIPLDSETGIYEMDIEVTNLYNETKSETFTFEVNEVEQTFTLNDGEDDFEETVDKIGNHTFNVTLENDLDSETELSTSISGDIENFTEVNDGDNITLDADEEKNVSVTFDIDSVDMYDGEIKFMDEEANYNSTLDVELEHISCDYRDETVCVAAAGDLNASADENDDIVKDFTVVNFGEKDESYSYSFTLSGNITDYTTLEMSEKVLDTENDSKTVNLTYSPTAPGFYSGTLEIGNTDDSVSIPVSLDSDVEATSVSLSLPETISLGEVREGSAVTKDVEIENTGDVEITALEYSSSTYTVSADSISIAPDAIETVTVEFSDVAAESGGLTVTAETGTDSTSETATVSATVIPNYLDRADDLEGRLISLDSQVSSDSEHQTDLNNAQTKIENLRAAYNRGDYEQAQALYNQVQTTLDTVEAEVRQSSVGGSTGQNNSNNGEVPFLPIAAGIFVFLLVGFVAYSSIELEPGDPLYNVLGK